MACITPATKVFHFLLQVLLYFIRNILLNTRLKLRGDFTTTTFMYVASLIYDCFNRQTPPARKISPTKNHQTHRGISMRISIVAPMPRKTIPIFRL